MAYKGVIEDFRKIRNLQIPENVPCVACSEEFDVKWYGKYCYEEVCQDGEKIYEVWNAAIKEFDYGLSIAFVLGLVLGMFRRAVFWILAKKGRN